MLAIMWYNELNTFAECENAMDWKVRLFPMKYVCDVCGYVYDEAEGCPEAGIAPGTKFEDLPEDFECPLCGVSKDQFSKE